MLEIEVTEEIKKYAEEQVEQYNFGQRGVADGTKEQQIVGIIGQTVVQDLLGLAWPEGSNGFDNGVDLILNNKKVDVKTMGRTVEMRDYFVHNFIALQLNYDVDILIFCSFNKRTNKLTICGFINKNDLHEKARFFKKGEERRRSDGSTFKLFTDLYEIPQSQLEPINSIEMLTEL